ncbi:MAG: UDP-N-acetylmuramate--L-alanine ligase [Candidatus Moranbacteria bacterium]|nr:UDP-N-acetylmuramate--L-alanine ligase [Candidatus Moranbacteria bacterium]
MTNYKKIYIIGIEGAGTSALASMYKKMGCEVSGSDQGDHFHKDVLKEKKIKVFNKYDKKNIQEDVELVVHSTSVTEDNEELVFARKKKFKVLSYPEALAELFNSKMGIAVCGTHGKTTTTAILASELKDLNMSPNAIVGSKVVDWKENSLVGDGDYFVIEADEYQNKLQYYNPYAVILTSVDYDHPDFFKNFEEYKKVFEEFVSKIPNHGILVYYNDSRDVIDVSKGARCRKVSYGFLSDSDYKIENIETKKSVMNPNLSIQKFEIFFKEETLGVFETELPGKHNILNATATVAMCHEMGLDLDKVKGSLASFSGTARRFEYIGEKNGAILIDDYAHHPEEVKTTLEAVRNMFENKKIITIFHPHSFSRTEALLSEFAQSFGNADDLIVLDIYGSAREESGNVSSADLVSLVNKFCPGKSVNIHTIKEVIADLKDKLNKDTVIISMGAGDVWKVTHTLVKK